VDFQNKESANKISHFEDSEHHQFKEQGFGVSSLSTFGSTKPNSVTSENSQELCGCGIVTSNSEPFTIAVTSHTGNIKSGDIILSIEGHILSGKSRDEVRSLMIGPEGTYLHIQILTSRATSDEGAPANFRMITPPFRDFPDHIYQFEETAKRKRLSAIPDVSRDAAGGTANSPWL
jgi:hypothetical protein